MLGVSTYLEHIVQGFENIISVSITDDITKLSELNHDSYLVDNGVFASANFLVNMKIVHFYNIRIQFH
jgi:hypothetical protein